TVSLDEPFTLRAVHTHLGGGGDAAIHENVRRAEPYLATPRARAEHLAQAECAEAVGKGFAVGRRMLVDQRDHGAAQRILHVPVGRTHARLPVHPAPAHQLLEDPRVDVAAAVVAVVEDEARAVEHGIEVALPLRDVPGAHGAQMHVADGALTQAVHEQAARVLPLVVAQVDVLRARDGFDDHIARRAGGARAYGEPYLLPRLIAQQG